MNNSLSSRARWALLFIVLLAVAASVGLRRGQAQSATPAAPVVYGEARVDVSSLNLRTGPHVSYTAVAYLMDGEQVRLVGRNRAGTWVQIELYNGYRGWVNARYLRSGVSIAALPVADVALLGITAFVQNDPIAIFAGPSTLYQRVGTARPGATLALNGRNEAATWVHVYLPDGRAGWAAADSPFLPTAAINDLPIITPFLDAPPPDLAAFYLVYIGPGFLYEPVDSVVEGQTLGIRGRTADARWVLVRLANGREGWIAAEIIQVAVPLEGVPVIEGIAPPQVVGWQAAGSEHAASPTGAPTEAPAQPPTATDEPTVTEEAMPTAEPTATALADATTAPAGGKGNPPPVTTDEPTAAATGAVTTKATATGAAPATSEAASPTPLPTRRATQTPRATATARATATPRVTATDIPATATDAATATSAPAAGGDTPTPAISVVYVYATPSEDNAPILRVVPGQSVVLLGRTADSEWVQIWLPGDQQGWIRASAIQVEIDLAVLPVVEP